MKMINSQSDINVSRILRLIWQKNGISRIEIATELGLDKSTITKIVSSLVNIGIVSEYAQGTTGPLGGRKPVYLEITKSFAAVGGIEINPEGFVCCLLDLPGNVLFEYTEKMPVNDCLEVFEIARMVLKAEAEKRNIKMVGIGTGLSGVVNSDAGIILQSIPLSVSSPFPFSHLASVKAEMPVLIENDARCCCYSERTLMHDMGTQNSIFLLMEIRQKQEKAKLDGSQISVGTGLIINGKIYKGNDFSAGEFRSLLWNGSKLGQFLSIEENMEKAEADINEKNSIFYELAMHVAFLVNMLNLETVYIGGLPADYAQKLAEMINKRIVYQWPYDSTHNCEVRLSSLGHLAVAFGAAGMFIDRFFALPSLASPLGTGPSILESLSEINSTGHIGKLV